MFINGQTNQKSYVKIKLEKHLNPFRFFIDLRNIEWMFYHKTFV